MQRKIIGNAWTDRAKEDLDSSRALMNEDQELDALYHMQQAIEKMLKGVISEYGENMDKTHDIVALTGIVEDLIQDDIPDTLIDYGEDITTWESDTRYPDNILNIDEEIPGWNAIDDEIDDWFFNLGNYGTLL